MEESEGPYIFAVWMHTAVRENSPSPKIAL